jgi:ABC-type transport system involved in multi-copper enzyme maturation permease subunit
MIHRAPILMIAHNTYLDARHNKVLHIAGMFAALLILFSLFLGEVSLFQNEKVVKDIGLAAISLLGVFIAIYLGVNSLFKELERRTIYTVISKPISRLEVLLGRFLGIVFVLGLVVITMTLYLYLVTALIESSIDWYLLPAIGLIYAELLIVAALAVFFSSFSTPFMSAFFTTGVFVIGRVSRDLADFGERSRNELFRFFASWIQRILDLEPFNLRTAAVHRLPIYWEDWVAPTVSALALCVFLLFLSYLSFQRRDFK